MSTIELDDLGPPLELPLSVEEGRTLAFSGVVSAVPSPYRPGIWLVGAAGKVGAARIGSVEVFIRPKVEIARILFLLGYAEHGDAWQQDVTVALREAITARCRAGCGGSGPVLQLLTYCTILDLPVGHLVYVRGNASPARHIVRQSGIEILCHAIDLSQPPEQLIGQMSNLAELVTATAVTSRRYPA